MLATRSTWWLPDWRRLLALLAFVLLAFVLMALPLSSQAQSQNMGWRVCASEGQACQLKGRGVVRYGVDGLWSTRVLSGAVACSNDLFGDPAPQQPKRCEMRDSAAGSGNDGWVFCAAEGETCQFRGSADVRFGADRSYTTRRAHGSIRCDVEAFGDPAYGQTKHCEVKAASANTERQPWAGSDRYNDAARWRHCANEGQTCNVQGRAEVRFGDGKRYALRTVRGDVQCNTSVFGDPAFGLVKHCEVRAASFGGLGDKGAQDGGWTRCAEEGKRCEVGSGRAQVRFGTRGRYVYRDAYGGLDCDIASFGSDPYPGELKQCETRR